MPTSFEAAVAAFEVDEILYELEEHAAGLTAGAGVIFSVSLKSSAIRAFVTPDRSSVTMEKHSGS
jgi:malate synthase